MAAALPFIIPAIPAIAGSLKGKESSGPAQVGGGGIMPQEMSHAMPPSILEKFGAGIKTAQPYFGAISSMMGGDEKEKEKSAPINPYASFQNPRIMPVQPSPLVARDLARIFRASSL